jgi:hypothetical protein
MAWPHPDHKPDLPAPCAATRLQRARPRLLDSGENFSDPPLAGPPAPRLSRASRS